MVGYASAAARWYQEFSASTLGHTDGPAGYLGPVAVQEFWDFLSSTLLAWNELLHATLDLMGSCSTCFSLLLSRLSVGVACLPVSTPNHCGLCHCVALDGSISNHGNGQMASGNTLRQVGCL